jgi:hypothetical protein
VNKILAVRPAFRIFCLTVSLGVALSSPSSGATSGAKPLAFNSVPTPKFAFPHYHTIGSYLEVRTSTQSVVAVNAVLRSAVIRFEHRFKVAAEQELRSVGGYIPPEYGLFETLTNVNFASANSDVVSVLLPTVQAYPAGVPYEAWLATTVMVSNGKSIDLSKALFVRQSSALHAIARAVYSDIVSGSTPTERCVAEGLKIITNTAALRGGFAPTKSHYRYFALTSNGLAVGIPQAQVASDACGRVEETIPYKALLPYLSSNGKELVAAVQSSGEH